jgi:porphobilinogen synthase
MAFPVTRPGRLRMTEMTRKMVRETRLAPEQFVYPMFVCPGEGVKRETASMPGNFQWSVDTLVEEVRSAQSLGIGGIILFGIPPAKDAAKLL